MDGLCCLGCGQPAAYEFKNLDDELGHARGELRLPPNRGGIDYKESHARAAEEVRR
jgi:hypothetical protein